MAALVAVEPSWALAEVNLLVPRVAKEDIFVREFISDDDLAKGGIRIAIRTAESSSAVLQAVLKGQADLALFNLEAFNAIQPENTATLSRLLLQPFQFRNSQELFDVEDTVFGLAVLAQINKTNIFPLSFWNQGLSRIIAQPEVRTVVDFRNIQIGSPFDTAADVLQKLGAKLTVVSGQHVRDAISKGEINGIEAAPRFINLELIRSVNGRSLIPDFRPMVGVLVASQRFWLEATEAKKQAISKAVADASIRTRTQILNQEQREREGVVGAQITYTQFDQNEFAFLESVSDKTYLEKQSQGQPEEQITLLKTSKALAQRDGSKKRPILIKGVAEPQ